MMTTPEAVLKIAGGGDQVVIPPGIAGNLEREVLKYAKGLYQTRIDPGGTYSV